MSIQAVGWVLDQDLPARPKLVLVAIANHASHTDGYCWLKAETIAGEAACSPRGVYNFVGDLIRNGFVRKELRRGDDGKQRSTDYWILFNRIPADWISVGKAAEELENEIDPDPEAEPSAEQDVGEVGTEIVEQTQYVACDINAPHAQRADGESSSGPVDKHVYADGPSAPACHRKNTAEPSKTNPLETRARGAVPRTYRPPPPPPPQPVGSIVGKQGELIFVFKPSRGYDAWKLEKERLTGHPFNAEMWREGRLGWFFPSLFPPEKPPPSEQSLASEAELDQFAKTG
jgi:hypothetical protein